VNSRNLIALLALAGGATSNFASAKVSADYRIAFEARSAYHVFEPRDLASNRLIFEPEQRVQFGKNFKAVTSFRAYAEGAFHSNQSRYAGQVASNDSLEWRVRDLYLQYQRGPWSLRAGNQQVVWGEAFGFYFADIVNPKDMREMGLNDLSSQRLPTPMLHTKYVLARGSVEALYIPKPFTNLMPSTGSDFAFPFRKLLPGASSISVNAERSLPLTLENGELGARASAVLGSNVDTSLFYLYYFDRAPNYRMRVTNPAPLNAEFDAFHSRLHTVGMTATADYSPFLLRAETLYTHRRTYDRVTPDGFGQAKSSEMTTVVGMDYSGTRWRLGTQVSLSARLETIEGALLPGQRAMVSLLASGELWREHSLDLRLSYLPRDGSSLSQLRYLIPISPQFEAILGVDLLMGGESSEFGQFKAASRGMLLFRAYLSS